MLSSPALANRACCPRGIVRRTNVECNAHSAESHMSLPTNQPRNMLHLARLFIDIQKSAGDGASNQLQQIHGGASDATCSSSGRSSSGILARLIHGSRQHMGILLGAAPVVLPPTVFDQLGGNYVFMAGFCGWFVAQFLKIFTKWYKSGVFSLKAFVDSGGMPSSHSALCSAVTTAIAIQQGLGSSTFAVSLCFSVIVMYDAMGVRRHAGLQAEVLNQVVEGLLEGHPISEKKLKEVLGHTPRQVLCGAVTGILMGLLYPRPF